MRSSTRRIAPALLTASLLLGVATPALAADISVADTSMTATAWKHYAVTRTSTLVTISFKPANSEADGSLLHQVNDQFKLQLRLRHQVGTGWEYLTPATSWFNVRTKKSLVVGLATGRQFRLSACCRTAADADTWWSGLLTY